MNLRDQFAISIAPTVYQDLMRNAYDSLDFEEVVRISYVFADKMLESSAGIQSAELGYANLYKDNSIGALHRSKEECDRVLVSEERRGVVKLIAVEVTPTNCET